MWLWAVVAVGLIVLIFFLPFQNWALLALLGFGTMESIGLLRPNDAYPPLTHVIHRYVPRWIAFSLIFAVWGGAGATWFGAPHPLRAAAMVGLLGWFIAHFDVTFDEDAAAAERAKYSRLRQLARRAGPN